LVEVRERILDGHTQIRYLIPVLCECYTPSKNRLIIALLIITILALPLVIISDFAIRDFRSDYGIADAIMVPIMGCLIFAFPFALLFLILGLRRYTQDRFLFALRRSLNSG